MNDNQDPRTRFGVDMLINGLLLHPGRTAGRVWVPENDQYCIERTSLEDRLARPDVPIDVRDYALARISAELAVPTIAAEDLDQGGAEVGGPSA